MVQSGAGNVSRDQADTSAAKKNRKQRRASKKVDASLAQDTFKHIGDTSALNRKNSSASITTSSSILPQSLQNYKATDRSHAQAPPVVQPSQRPLTPSNKRKRPSDSEERSYLQNGLPVGGNTSLQISGNGNTAALDSSRAKKKRKRAKASNVAADTSAQGISSPPQSAIQAVKPVVATIAQNGFQEVKASGQNEHSAPPNATRDTTKQTVMPQDPLTSSANAGSSELKRQQKKQKRKEKMRKRNAGGNTTSHQATISLDQPSEEAPAETAVERDAHALVPESKQDSPRSRKSTLQSDSDAASRQVSLLAQPRLNGDDAPAQSVDSIPANSTIVSSAALIGDSSQNLRGIRSPSPIAQSVQAGPSTAPAIFKQQANPPAADANMEIVSPNEEQRRLPTLAPTLRTAVAQQPTATIQPNHVLSQIRKMYIHVATQTDPVIILPAGAASVPAKLIPLSGPDKGKGRMQDEPIDKADVYPTSKASPGKRISSRSPASESRVEDRIRLFDEESDVDLQSFSMPEYDGDDTNHTEDEREGLYLPESTTSAAKRAIVSPPSSASSSHTSAASADKEAFASVVSEATHTIPKSAKAAKSKYMPAMVTSSATAADSPLAKKKGKVASTTPSRIQEAIVHEIAPHANAAASALAATPCSPVLPEDDGMDTDPIQEESAPTSVPSEPQRHVSQASLQPSPIETPTSPFKTKSVSRAGSRVHPVVEIPLRRTSSPASPRKSPTKLTQLPTGSTSSTGTSETIAKDATGTLQNGTLYGDALRNTRTSPSRTLQDNTTSISSSQSLHPPPTLAASSEVSTRSLSTDPYPTSDPLNVSESLPKELEAPPAEQEDHRKPEEAASQATARVLSFLNGVQDESSDESESSASEDDVVEDTEAELAEARRRRRAAASRLGKRARAVSSSPEAPSDVEEEDGNLENPTADESMNQMPRISEPAEETPHPCTPPDMKVVPGSPSSAILNPGSQTAHDAATKKGIESQELLAMISQMPANGMHTPSQKSDSASSGGTVVPPATDATTEPATAILAPGTLHDEGLAADSQDATAESAGSVSSARARSDPLLPEGHGHGVRQSAEIGRPSDPPVPAEATTQTPHVDVEHQYKTTDEYERVHTGNHAEASLESTEVMLSASNDLSELISESTGSSFSMQHASPPPPVTLPSTLPSALAPSFHLEQSGSPTDSSHVDEQAPVSGGQAPSPEASILQEAFLAPRSPVKPSAQDGSRLYPSLVTLEEEMSQPLIAAVTVQSSSPLNDESQDELAETQQPRLAAMRFADFPGPTPPPIPTGFDTASQIDELMQSSCDEISMQGPVTLSTMADSQETHSSSDGSSLDGDIEHQLIANPRKSTAGASSNEKFGPNQTSSAAIDSPSDTHSSGISENPLDASRLAEVNSRTQEVVMQDTTPSPSFVSSSNDADAGLHHTALPDGRSNAFLRTFPKPLTTAIPSVLPRSNSISAIQQRFRGKIAERRNSGTLAKVAAPPKPPATASTPMVSDDDDESDDDSDEELIFGKGTEGRSVTRRIGLAALK